MSTDASGHSLGNRSSANALKRIDEAVCAFDDEWQFTFVNDRAATLLDRVPDDLLGEVVWEAVPEFEDRAISDKLREAVETETPVRFESHNDRTDRWFNVGIYPSDDGVTACFYDKTEKRGETLELQRQRRLFETVFDETEDALVVTDTDRRITDFNPAAERLFGYDASEVIGEKSRQLYADSVDYQREGEKRFNERTLQGDETYIVEYERADGTTFDGETLGTPIGSDGEAFAFLASIRDISRRVQYEQEIEAHNNTLRSVHEITTDEERSFDEQIEQLLELGRHQLGLDGGLLASIEADVYTVDHAVGRDETVQSGDQFELRESDSPLIPDGTDPLARADASDTESVEHPVYDQRELRSFIGVPVVVDGERYGTLHFSGSQPREQAFTESEQTLVRVLAQWVGKELGQQQSRTRATANRKRLRQIIDILPQLVFSKDRHGEYILANQALADAYGTTVDELEGAMDADFAESEEEVRQFREDDLAVIDSGEPKEIPEEPLTTAAGEQLTVQTTKVPYDPVDHETEAVLGVATDITERKQREQELEAATQRLMFALEGTNTAIWELNLDTDEVIWTGSMEQLLGTEEDSFEGTFDAFADRVHSDDLAAVEEALDRVGKRTDSIQIEYRIQRDDGVEIWVEARAELRERTDGSDRLVGILSDITDRKERESELELQSEAMEVAMDGIAILDGDEYVYMNQAHADIFEYDPTELMGHEWRGLYDETEIERLEREVFPSLAEDGEWRGEALGRKRDGTSVLQDLGLSLLDSGELICTNRDITEQKDRERELARQRTRIRALFDQSPDGVVIHDEEGDVIDANDTMTENLGVDRQTLLSMSVSEFEVGITQSELTSIWSDITADETLKVEGEHRRQNGEVFPVEVWVNRVEVGGKDRFIAVSRDISSRREREEELRELKERLDLAVEGGQIGIWDWNMSTDYVTFNDQWASMLGFSLDELEPTLETWEERVHPADMAHVEERLETHIAGERELYDCEHRMQTKSGDWKWIRDVGRVVDRDDDGTPRRAVGIHLDITDQKESELFLEEERDMFAQGPAVVFKWANEEGWPVEYVSGNVTETFGYTPEQLQSGAVPYTDLIHDEDFDRVSSEVENQTDETTERFSHEPYRMVTNAGEIRWVTDNTKIIRDEGEITHYLGYLIDITEQKRLEQSLRDSERSLRQLTEIASDTDQGFEEKLSRLLELGTERLGVSFGFLNRVEQDTQHVVQAVGDHPQLQPGETAPKSESYCRKTLQQDDVLDISDAVAEGWADDSAYERFDLGCYIGGTVVVDGDQYGTLCFADHADRSHAFDDTEKAFVELLVQWISYELTTDSFERKLQEINDTAQRLMTAPTRADVATLTTKSAKSILGMQVTGIWWYDEEADALVPEQQSDEATAIVGEQPTFERGGSIAWDAFEEGTAQVYDDLQTVPERYNDATALRSEVAVPMGEYGVIIASSTEPQAFSETDLNLLEVLSATVESAVTRARREQTLRKTQRKLKQSNEELEQFAYAASHDLQEPLRTVSSYLTLLERRYGDELDEDATEFIDFAVDGADRMREMIQALLAYSRVDTRGRQFESIEASTVFERVTENLAMTIEESGATVSTPDGETTISGDQSQLVQLFQNLIENGIKYNETTPHIEISATAHDGLVSFEVTDNGIGMESDQIDTIFDVFQRLHTREEFDGTGIGLSLCRKIVERHDGDIAVESEPGKGSTFIVTVPEGERSEQ